MIGGIPPYPMTSYQSTQTLLYKRQRAGSHSHSSQYRNRCCQKFLDEDRCYVKTMNRSKHPLDYQTQLSLLAPVDDPRNVDNRWDMLPVELKHMIVDMVVKPHEAEQKAYWKVCYRSVVGHLLSVTHCRACGDSKIPSVATIRLGNSSFLCPNYYRYTLGVTDTVFDALLTTYWDRHVGNRDITKTKV